MKSLGYEEVIVDSMGNVLGRIGRGEKSILFDSHVDTVEVNDEKEWEVPPFSGEIVDGRLYGRGSVDMKYSVAASIYAGVIAKEWVLILAEQFMYPARCSRKTAMAKT
jgi:acetylornithine deacetylase/succinyl-diaminopimelate desuccinylase-like protein